VTTTTERTSRSEAFRSAIAAFIDSQREAKLNGKEHANAASKHDYGTWLADAARRVRQLQAATHVLKATHPSARGSNLNVQPSELPAHVEIGTHVLGSSYAEDVAVDNAAALGLLKFLKLEVEGRCLLDWVQSRDPDMRQALHRDEATAESWMAAFSLVRNDLQPATHKAAKQLYWLVGDDPADDTQYYLLQPLFSSSLAHAVHAEIQDARFGDLNKAARQARRDKQPFEGTYRNYSNLVTRKLGGTKPQNISQLNSERGGVNYLLASLPPRWTQARAIRLLGQESAVEQFGWRREVRDLVNQLAAFLLTDPDPTEPTRHKRKGIEQALGAQLAAFASIVQDSHEPGWTRDPNCQLPQCEQLWLDPGRIELPPRDEHLADDLAFNAAYTFGQWPDDVASRFAHWVNARLHDAGLVTVSVAEHRHWARQAIVDAAWPVPMQRRAGGER
jgi:CRISPR-associated protein Csy1